MSSSYQDLVNVASFWKKRENFDAERGALTHYCRDCTKLVEAEIVDDDRAEYRCPLCSGQNIATGTRASVVTHYKIK